MRRRGRMCRREACGSARAALAKVVKRNLCVRGRHERAADHGQVREEQQSVLPSEAVGDLAGARWQCRERRGEKEDHCECVGLVRVLSVVHVREEPLKRGPVVVHEPADEADAVPLVHSARRAERG
jgi:hypothetical protein